jgi:hypothetical protein
MSIDSGGAIRVSSGIREEWPVCFDVVIYVSKNQNNRIIINNLYWVQPDLKQSWMSHDGFEIIGLSCEVLCVASRQLSCRIGQRRNCFQTGRRPRTR